MGLIEDLNGFLGLSKAIACKLQAVIIVLKCVVQVFGKNLAAII